MDRFSSAFLQECRRRLIQTKMDLLNRMRNSRAEYSVFDKTGGDEADQTMSLLAENDFLSRQSRLREMVLEIELALARIDNGRYGICEETEEAIEKERLAAIPWTRLSIEGAEMREEFRKRYVR